MESLKRVRTPIENRIAQAKSNEQEQEVGQRGSSPDFFEKPSEYAA